MIATRCPDCLQPGSAPPEAAGRKVRCTKCAAVFRIPLPDAPPDDAAEVAWQPGLQAPGEEPVFDLSKLDAPTEKPLDLDGEREPPRKRRRDDEEYEPRRRRRSDADAWNRLQLPVSLALIGAATLGGLAWCFEANRLGKIDGTNAFHPDNATGFSAVMYGFAGIVVGSILGGLGGFWYSFTTDESRRSRRGRV